MSGAPPLTLHRRLGPGTVLRSGTHAPYRGVAAFAGEPHAVRSDLVGTTARQPLRPSDRGIVCLVHVTDLQLADVQSPARFEFFNHEIRDPRFAGLLPTQRPQEALTGHAADAMVRTVNRLTKGPLTARPPELVVTSGDAIDNAQWNELRAFLALYDGGLVRLDSGGRVYEGVQAGRWPDRIFWVPDGGGTAVDLFRAAYGFPRLTGLNDRALRPFRADGLRFPWLACHGNHEALVQGVGVVTPELAAGMVGDRKPFALDERCDRDRALDTFIEDAHLFLDGPHVRVTPDPRRRPITRREFVDAHLRSHGRPKGHGYTSRNHLDGTAYYVHDSAAARVIVLDTACPGGSADGCVDADQLRWLEQRLIEVHSSFRAADSSTLRTAAGDRLVLIVSHHGSDTLASRRAHAGPDGAPHAGGVELLAMLHRFDNVVLWLNGHTHRNRVVARQDPHRPGHGFWEITTCAVVDWPCQARIIELVDAGAGLLAIASTMIDHDSPDPPVEPRAGPELAGLHRQLAGNVPWAGFDCGRDGTPGDRNVILLAPAPFPLGRLPRV